ncbi:MAG TPA: sigma-54 dependent transcriptional regulator [Polyangiales bacterium]|nr:sigma-54 dependent transcriptional regulator [Polyangiales bacterium]
MSARVLVVDDESSLREMLQLLLKRNGYSVETADGQRRAMELLRAHEPFDVVVTDLSMPDGSGMGVLADARKVEESTQVIMITAYATTAQAVQAMREGAYDYIKKPFKNDELLAVIEKALEKRSIVDQNRALRRRVQEGFRTGDVVGKSPAMQRVLRLVERVAGAPTSVLITGESGTGKEVIARALHHTGDRGQKPFVAINCAALPETLLESELFGYEKGAFTGADTRKEGLFRAAGSGTLFLDEIGELPLALQVKLLRVLQERTVRPVGGREEIPFACRVIAATNRDVKRDVAEGRFREDLYYRINVINLHLPPLRERPEDVPLLADHFLIKHSAVQNKRLSFTAEAMRYIVGRNYRGNVRELENLVERAVTLAIDGRVELGDLDYDPAAQAGGPRLPWIELPDSGFDLDAYLAEIERRVLVAALERTHGVRKDAAKLLGTTFRSMRYRLSKYGLGDAEDEVESGETDGVVQDGERRSEP